MKDKNQFDFFLLQTSSITYFCTCYHRFQIALTSGLIVVGQESRATVGVTCVFAALYGMLFAYTAPIQDFFENKLMVTALSVTFVNLGIGAVSRIPAENRPPAEDPLLDTLMFKITVIGANTLVIGQLICKIKDYLIFFARNTSRDTIFKGTNFRYSLAKHENLAPVVNAFFF